MDSPPRIYLDNAATSWPKPPAVYVAMDEYQRHIGAPAGRGAYDAGQEVERHIENCRRAIARLIGASESKRIVFGFNGTDVLNIALHGLIKPGDHVVTSVTEHNSVLRPLHTLQELHDVSVTYVGCNAQGVIDPDEVVESVTSKTSLVALSQASNVTGAIQPIADIGERLRDKQARLLVDAAQSLGHIPIDVVELNVDLLAASGHKGLLGPLGTGVLYIGPGCQQQMVSFRQGGTGTHSELDAQPNELPHKFEAGNLNVPGLYGLSAGVEFVQSQGVATMREHQQQLSHALRSGLGAVDGVRLFGPEDAQACTGVVSFTMDGLDPQEVAALLDNTFHIQVRAGLHCAPRMHAALGTSASGGTVRMSLGDFNSEEEVETAVTAVREIATSINSIT